MKNFSPFAFLLILLFISNTNIAQIPLDGLIGYYTLDGMAADSSGMSHDGTIVGAVTSTQDRFGNEDGALFFNSGHIDTGNPLAYQLSESISIAVWINPNQVNDWSAIVTKWGGFNNGGYYLGINPEGALVRWNLDMPMPIDGDTIPVNTWTHIVSTYDGDSVKIYQDGQFVIGSSYSSPITNNNASLVIGAQMNFLDNYQFFGAMDDVLIYDRALSADEVLAIFDPTTPVNDLVENNLNVSIYPNPTSDYLFIKNKSNLKISSLSIIDSNGKFIKSAKIDSNPIDLSDLPKGIYFLNISTDQANINKKIAVF